MGMGETVPGTGEVAKFILGGSEISMGMGVEAKAVIGYAMFYDTDGPRAMLAPYRVFRQDWTHVTVTVWVLR
jgi:hypothetical protein